MYAPYNPSAKLNGRGRRVVEILAAGGFARSALETGYGGREKFCVRVYDADGALVPGLGYAAVANAIAVGALISRPCARSSTWPSEYVIRPEYVAAEAVAA
jgi:hypothetical protein